MDRDKIIKLFCDQHGYNGHYGYNKKTTNHKIIISKNDNNGGAFLSEDEYQKLDEEKLLELLELLHVGFKEKYEE